VPLAEENARANARGSVTTNSSVIQLSRCASIGPRRCLAQKLEKFNFCSTSIDYATCGKRLRGQLATDARRLPGLSGVRDPQQGSRERDGADALGRAAARCFALRLNSVTAPSEPAKQSPKIATINDQLRIVGCDVSCPSRRCMVPRHDFASYEDKVLISIDDLPNILATELQSFTSPLRRPVRPTKALACSEHRGCSALFFIITPRILRCSGPVS